MVIFHKHHLTFEDKCQCGIEWPNAIVAILSQGARVTAPMTTGTGDEARGAGDTWHRGAS